MLGVFEDREGWRARLGASMVTPVKGTVILKWATPEPARNYREMLAWLPMRAYDEYSGRDAWVWMRTVRVFSDGRVTFSSFWI